MEKTSEEEENDDENFDFYWYLEDEWAAIRYITCYPQWNHINPGNFFHGIIVCRAVLNRHLCTVKIPLKFELNSFLLSLSLVVFSILIEFYFAICQRLLH